MSPRLPPKWSSDEKAAVPEDPRCDAPHCLWTEAHSSQLGTLRSFLLWPLLPSPDAPSASFLAFPCLVQSPSLARRSEVLHPLCEGLGLFLPASLCWALLPRSSPPSPHRLLSGTPPASLPLRPPCLVAPRAPWVDLFCGTLLFIRLHVLALEEQTSISHCLCVARCFVSACWNMYSNKEVSTVNYRMTERVTFRSHLQENLSLVTCVYLGDFWVLSVLEEVLAFPAVPARWALKT